MRRIKMKRNIFWLGMLVITLTFSMAACGGDDDSGGGNPQIVTYTGTSGGTTYILVITGDTAYVLTVGQKTSSGTVTNKTGGVLTLKPSNATDTFTATVSGSGLTAMSGTITYTDNTTTAAPGELSPVTPNPGTGGTFTLSGIPAEYNGKYAGLHGTSTTKDLVGATNINISTGSATLVPITNGSVSLPMWARSDTTSDFVKYSSNETANVSFAISNSATFNGDWDAALVVVLFSSVTFSNGGATKTWNQGEVSGGSGNGGGTTWTAVSNSRFGTNNTIRAIAYGNNKFVAVGYDFNSYNRTSSGRMAYSSDSITWTAVTDSKFDEDQILAIAWGNNKFVAGGAYGKMAYSSDGITWTAITTTVWDWNNGGSTTKSHIDSIAYGNNKFVAVGGNSPSSKVMATSSDGITWTAVADSTFSQYEIRAIAYGNNKFVTGGQNLKIATSTDGITWTVEKYSESTLNQIYAIAYGNNKFVAGGTHGKMAYSSDGVTWTAVSDSTFGNNSMSNIIRAIAYGNNKFVAVGYSGKMAYSSDGITWTAVEDSKFGTTEIYAIAYANGKFVAGGGEGLIRYSTGN
jgi:hypothetical protein